MKRSLALKRHTGRLLAALLVAAPLLIAAAHPVTQVLLCAAALGTSVVYLWGTSRVQLSAFAVIATTALAATACQVLPLPAVVVGLVAPHARALRNEVAAVPPRWMPLTLDVPATLLELCKGFTELGLLVVVSRFARRRHRARRLMLVFAALGGVLGVLTLVERALGMQTILGLYRVQSTPGSGLFGTFVNGNHAASFFALSALAAAGCAIESRRPRRLLLTAAAAISTITLFVTQSRAGAVGFLVGVLVFSAVLLARRFGWSRGAALSVALTLAFGTSAVSMSDGLRNRLADYDHADFWRNQKTRGWLAAFEVVRDYPWLGVGRGAFEAPATQYREVSDGVRLVYPENVLLQLSAEWGVPITLLILLLFGRATARRAREVGELEPAALSAACGVLAVLVHELADFGLELPGVAIPTVMALGVVIARTDESRSPDAACVGARGASRPVMVGAAVAWGISLAAGAWAARHTLWADGMRVRAASVAHPANESELIHDAQQRHPADYYLELAAANDAMTSDPSRVLAHLGRATRLCPSSAWAHVYTARWLARLHRPAQSALEYRLAHERGFRAPMDEVIRSTGEHAQSAVPDTPESLFSLADAFIELRLGQQALAACDRAVVVAHGSEDALINRLRRTTIVGDAGAVRTAVRALLDSLPSANGYATAANALAALDDLDAAAAVISEAMKTHPHAGSLALERARLSLLGGDAAAAHEALSAKTVRTLTFTVAERIEMQRLLAQIAERSGDAAAAAAARARANALSGPGGTAGQTAQR